jgi:hypothetical protein
MLTLPLRPLLLAGALLFTSAAARADIRVGIDVSTTGPAASIGIPSKNTVLMWPQTGRPEGALRDPGRRHRSGRGGAQRAQADL